MFDTRSENDIKQDIAEEPPHRCDTCAYASPLCASCDSDCYWQ